MTIWVVTVGSGGRMGWTAKVSDLSEKGKRHWHDAPVNTYGAFGHGGLRAMVVISSLDLIVSWNDANIRSRNEENQALKLLVDAVINPPASTSSN